MTSRGRTKKNGLNRVVRLLKTFNVGIKPDTIHVQYVHPWGLGKYLALSLHSWFLTYSVYRKLRCKYTDELFALKKWCRMPSGSELALQNGFAFFFCVTT